MLSDVSFAVEPGETVAIMGATGSGKSTLIDLIPRFYDVTAGRITFDGTVLLAERILLLDQGRIAAMGTHQQLLAADSMYRDIYRSQLGEPPGEKAGLHE